MERTGKRNHFTASIFYGNYFYGICAVTLSVEATLQQKSQLNNILYFLFVFSSTVVFYTIPYINETNNNEHNKRTQWYLQNKKLVWWSQFLLSVYVIGFITFFIISYNHQLQRTSLPEWVLLIFFPIAGVLYYGLTDSENNKYNIRKIGWLKPFIIGMVWAGLVTIYPVLFYTIIHGQQYEPKLISYMLTLKNFMFISLLGIMFDIKDHALDSYLRLNTFIVKVGLRKTIFNILLPLSVLGFCTFITYGIAHHFSIIRILLNTIPFVALVIVAYSLRRRKTLLYYLIVVDGLMVIKAICGSIAMIFF